MQSEYDVVIVGSGAGGGQMAYVLAMEGMKDIGYVGNIAQVEWNGPPAEVLKKLNLPTQ